jgi:phosphosulfolactate phosphohydrolase-like enzyme
MKIEFSVWLAKSIEIINQNTVCIVTDALRGTITIVVFLESV